MRSTDNNHFRVMIGADGDDYVFRSGLSYDKAVEVKSKLKLVTGAYSYIEPDTIENCGAPFQRKTIC